MPPARAWRRLAAAIPLSLVLAVSGAGCATVQGPPDPQDPWEGFNRSMFELNQTLDKALIRPVAELYQKVTPDPVDRAVTNFFGNLNDVLVVMNDLLQFKIEQAVSDLGRIVANTTFGVLGLFDVATRFGLEKHDEDLGQSMGYWGMDTGPYLVLPILGPSSLRDTVGRAGEFAVSPLDVFDGPFDLLVTLILRDEIDIWEGRVSRIIAEYVVHLADTGEFDPRGKPDRESDRIALYGLLRARNRAEARVHHRRPVPGLRGDQRQVHRLAVRRGRDRARGGERPQEQGQDGRAGRQAQGHTAAGRRARQEYLYAQRDEAPAQVPARRQAGRARRARRHPRATSPPARGRHARP